MPGVRQTEGLGVLVVPRPGSVSHCDLHCLPLTVSAATDRLLCVFVCVHMCVFLCKINISFGCVFSLHQ